MTRARNHLGRALFRLADLDAADALFAESIRLDPSHGEAYESRAIVAEVRGDQSTAAALFQAALDRMEFLRYSARRLGWIRATSRDPALRDGAQAVALFERLAARSDFRDASALDGLAAALAEAGRFDDAVARARQAAERARAAGNPHAAAQSAERAELYRQREVLRLP